MNQWNVFAFVFVWCVNKSKPLTLRAYIVLGNEQIFSHYFGQRNEAQLNGKMECSEFCDAINFTALNGISMSAAMETPPGGKIPVELRERERLK